MFVCLQETKRTDAQGLYYVYSTYGLNVIFTLRVKWGRVGKKRLFNF